MKAKAFMILSVDMPRIKKVSNILLKDDVVENIHELYGHYDIIIRIEAKTRAELDDYMEGRIKSIPGIKHTEMLIASRPVKEIKTRVMSDNLESEAFILISAKRGKKKSLANKLAKFNQVDMCYELYGQYDVIIKVKDKNNRLLEDFMQKEIRSIPEISGTETLIVSDVP